MRGGPLLPLMLLGALACASPGAPPGDSPLEPLPQLGAYAPDEPDRLARNLAAEALAGRQERARRLLAELEAWDATRRANDEPPTGLVPVARDLVNAALGDPLAYRRAARELLEREDLGRGLRNRLEAAVADDPLLLAERRLRDERVKDVAQVFNAVVAPLARAATAGVRGAWSFTRSVTELALSERSEDELALRERQALAHRKNFLERHPDSPRAPEIARLVEESQRRWYRTRRDRTLRQGRDAWEKGQWRRALVMARRAERYAPEDPEAVALGKKAGERLLRQREERGRSLRAAPETAHLDRDPRARELAVALLHPEGEVTAAAEALLEPEPEGPLGDEARYARALAVAESDGPEAEDRGWERLEELAGADPARANMVRHAAAAVYSSRQNPWGAFEDARATNRRSKLAWIVFGSLGAGPRDRDLPAAVEWLVSFPGYVESLLSIPNRLISYPWMRPWPFGRRPAVLARRYLERYPDGAHAREAARWLEGWERRRGNALGAWRVAEAYGGYAPEEIAGLRKDAAEQALEAARGQKRGDLRLAMLREVARDFEGTSAAHRAGMLARAQLEEATTQRIRITRQFLLENPQVAGPQGLGLRPGLLDDDPANGELHREGVVLAGGRSVELHFLGESGEHSEPSVKQTRRLGEERLSRVVALLDETAVRNYAADPDDVLEPDADRDLYFERARLGVADEPDRRAGARSTYTFAGMRERYGLVRGRESILPFDLVVQGTFPDVSISAFPRLRTPKTTPDSILYR